MNMLGLANDAQEIGNKRVNTFVCIKRSFFSCLNRYLSNAQLELKHPCEMHEGQEKQMLQNSEAFNK